MESRMLIDDFKTVVEAAGIKREDVGALKRLARSRLARYLEDYFSSINKNLISKLKTPQEKIDHLKVIQRDHWLETLSFALSENFQQKSCDVGRAFARSGIPASWRVTAYTWIVIKYIDSIYLKYYFRPLKFRRVLRTLFVRMMSDMMCSIQGHEREGDIANLRQTASNIQDVNEVAVELTILAKNTHDMAVSVGAISAASAELVQSVNEIAHNSQAAAGDASFADRVVSMAASEVKRGADAMSNISDAVDETLRRVDELSGACEQIGQILFFIEGVAKHTNLLALNATIEAARAGEAGRGFGVVASEVKTLAEQTARATCDIAGQIAQLRTEMEGMREITRRSKEAAVEGERAIAEASGGMQEILARVANVSGEMQDISRILEQQGEASAEVAQNIDKVANSARDNQQLLSGMVEKLRLCTDRFSADVQTYFDPSSDRALCEMAKVDHVLFKARVVDALTGRSQWKPDSVPDHHACRLGKWYDEAPAKTRELQAYKEMVAPHQQVHASAKRALQAYEHGDHDEVMKALSELSAASAQVIAKLDALSNAL